MTSSETVPSPSKPTTPGSIEALKQLKKVETELDSQLKSVQLEGEQTLARLRAEAETIVREARAQAERDRELTIAQARSRVAKEAEAIVIEGRKAAEEVARAADRDMSILGEKLLGVVLGTLRRT